jgi:hypothetical protein
MQVGYHVDWAAGFPFAALALPNNYGQPPVSVWAFGFESSPALINVSGGHWTGLESAEHQVRLQAAAEGLRLSRYRAILRHRYHDIMGTLGAPQRESEGGI